MPPRHDRYHQPEYNNKNDPEIDLPPSLKEAIISFILTSACRYFRGYETKVNAYSCDQVCRCSRYRLQTS